MAEQPHGRMIRRVTGVDIVRTSQGNGQSGAYALELELDGGVEQYLLVPAENELNTVLRLLQRSQNIFLDQRTEELTFEHYGGGGS